LNIKTKTEYYFSTGGKSLQMQDDYKSGLNASSEKRDCLEEKFGEDYFQGVGSNYPLSGYENTPDMIKDFSSTVRFLISQLGTQASFLDVGCAYGFLVKLAYEQGLDAYGLDISSYAIKRGKELNHEIKDRLIVAKAEKVASVYGEKRFNVISALEVLEHVPNPREALLSIYLGLKRKGWLLISTPSPVLWGDKDVTHIFVRSLKDWKKELKQLGFEVKAPFFFYSPSNKILAQIGTALDRNKHLSELWRRIVGTFISLDRRYSRQQHILAIRK
jgi:2-polyprenyl-3-methyl-5-hydroxy-6-metoxy-1,4-benzoquinol methylase